MLGEAQACSELGKMGLQMCVRARGGVYLRMEAGEWEFLKDELDGNSSAESLALAQMERRWAVRAGAMLKAERSGACVESSAQWSCLLRTGRGWR